MITAAVQHIVVTQGYDWTRDLQIFVPVVIAFIVALTAYVKAHTNERRAAVTEGKTAVLENAINGPMTDMLRRMSALESEVHGTGSATPKQ